MRDAARRATALGAAATSRGRAAPSGGAQWRRALGRRARRPTAQLDGWSPSSSSSAAALDAAVAARRRPARTGRRRRPAALGRRAAVQAPAAAGRPRAAHRAARRPGTTWCCPPAQRAIAARRSPRRSGTRATVHDALGLRGARRPRAAASRRCSPARAAPARRWPPRCSPATSSSTSTGSTSARSSASTSARPRRTSRRVFDAAEGGGAILLFDEADALFGKRTEVKRQPRPLRQHRGQLPAAADGDLPRPRHPHHQPREHARPGVPAPAPRSSSSSRSRTPTARARSGGGSSRAQTPRRGPGPRDALARLTVAGGNIRNIALNAAFLAADDGGPVQMDASCAARPQRVRQARTAR